MSSLESVTVMLSSPRLVRFKHKAEGGNLHRLIDSSRFVFGLYLLI